MRWALIGLLLLHGFIHLMGFAKAFGYAEMPQLTQPISREWGVVWLLAGGLVVATALTLLFLPALYAAWFRVPRPSEALPGDGDEIAQAPPPHPTQRPLPSPH